MPPHLHHLRVGLVATTVGAVGLALALPAGASAATTTTKVQVTAVPHWTAHARNIGAVAARTPLRLTAVLNLRNSVGAQKLALAVSDPTSTQYKHYVTPAQWRAKFAPTSAQIASVTKWLSHQGFKVGKVPANGRYVSFTGTALQANRAFGTSVHGYVLDGARVTANAKPVVLPASVARVVAGISGLDSSAKSQPTHLTGQASRDATTKRSTAPTLTTARAKPADELPPPDPVFRNSGPCSAYFGELAAPYPSPFATPLTYVPCGYKPAQLRGAYNLTPFQSAGYDGRGATVAIVDAYASPFLPGDAQRYAARNDSSHPLRSYQYSENLPLTFTDTEACGAGGWYGEQTLDVEAVHAMAPAANVLYVGGQSCNDADLAAAVNTIVDNNLAQIITNSYGDYGEPSSVDASVQEFLQTSLQAAAEGITVLFSSGDNGDEIDNTGTRQVDWQASDPFTTAVGGTTLQLGKTNNWEAEIGWGTGISPLTNGHFPLPAVFQSGGGGGTSRLFDQPSYQHGVVPQAIARSNGSNKPMRAVPDVAMDADVQSGMLIGQSQTFPDGSIKYSEYRIGGTSLSSPLMAGLTAVEEQALHAQLGFLNPLLYKVLYGTSALHDVNNGRAITSGVVRVNFANSFDASAGLTTSLRTFNQTGTIWTRKGYDDVTGVGTPDALNFLLTTAGLQKQGAHGPAPRR